MHRLILCEELFNLPELKALQTTAMKNENLFEKIMETTKVCSLGQITTALFEVGGQYRRIM